MEHLADRLGEETAPMARLVAPLPERLRAGLPVIAVDDPQAADVRQLLAAHLAFCRQESPPEDVHALDISGLLDPKVTFFSYRLEGHLLGVGALKSIDDEHAEIKSMHTARSARRSGVGTAILRHVISFAREHGYERLSLETGTMAAFEPARALYRREGFVPCGRFADYPESPNSTYFTLGLDGSGTARGG
jgi:putative acetyltransferase